MSKKPLLKSPKKPLLKTPKVRKKICFKQKMEFNSPSTVYCRSFCKFGTCRNPKCKFVHDPTKISICLHFLYSKCKTINCPLSHVVSPDRMPDCKYFLRGCCKAENCIYRHVKVNKNAKLCEQFYKGYYCVRGIMCTKAHLFECSTFSKTGKCPHGDNCNFGHPTLNSIYPQNQSKPQAASNSSKKNTKIETSKYKKINTMKSPEKAQTKTEAIETTEHKSEDNLKSKLNLLLSKRLKLSKDCNGKISPQDDGAFESGLDFISLSTDSVSDACTEIIPMSKETKSESVNSVKRKYFIIDSDEEKSSDLKIFDVALSHELGCRPQLKIIPDFLKTKCS